MPSKKSKQAPVDETPETEDENIDETDIETPPEEDENIEPEVENDPVPEETQEPPLEQAVHFRNANITSLSFVTETGKMYSFTDGVFSTYDQNVIERLKQTEDFKN
jgi:hypothetical protein